MSRQVDPNWLFLPSGNLLTHEEYEEISNKIRQNEARARYARRVKPYRQPDAVVLLNHVQYLQKRLAQIADMTVCVPERVDWALNRIQEIAVDTLQGKDSK